MKPFALYTVTFVLMKQAIAWGMSSDCLCCAPTVCPPPVICPPRICPPCFPPAPVASPVAPAARSISICCHTCICTVRRKRNISSNNNTIHEINPICSNEQLMMIMEKEIRANAVQSMFAIKKAADYKLEAEFNVFCATDDLAHLTYTENFCQHKKGNVICFAYKS